ncbi:SGNH/GDSL hydrolase family protein [Kitasatospora aureofaciens]|uniref:SGNH/GDSL hydrolase family protein n=1 Tax=Kitasatospora aureofaciens TaxID=1894 RepID=UPI001C490417|nr:SGNH/GDSL hydrolase family protein [Kitasatospora aureofaciens]MBV6700935.1 SGNH/GDSL hydrolase family protein [Kitasatospora aureofaciens]
MPRPRLLAALAAVPLLCAALAAPASAAPTPRYAALGDSYAAGVAAGSYDPASGDCRRSSRGYPALWAAAHGAALTDVACLGATTEDVRREQLPKVGADTTVVTVTVGGNDLGFTAAATDCLQPLTTDARCNRTLDATEHRIDEEMPGRLSALYDAVRTAAPAARVVVTGYPRLLQTGTVCLLATDARRQRFNALADRLDELIRRQSTAHGFAFADVRTAFDGHGACAGGGEEWINGIVLARLWESFHPTADGQARGYLPAVASLM